MKTKLLLISLLCIGLLSCEKDNKRENDKNTPSYIKNGALPGVFSVSDTKQVKFSQGNLQYQASTKTWRFAEHQYDYIGEDNQNISSTYSGWIDLFGWGTGKNPINTSTDYEDYSTFVDWGVNKISNGGNVANAWFTLSYNEWEYLLYTRSKALHSLASVMGINGLIILPDNWDIPEGVSYTRTTSDYTTNVYGESKWALMEEAGAVFLPAAGNRYGTSMGDVGTDGYYWSCFDSDTDNGYLIFDSDGVDMLSSGCYGLSVRLCSEISSK